MYIETGDKIKQNKFKFRFLTKCNFPNRATIVAGSVCLGETVMPVTGWKDKQPINSQGWQRLSVTQQICLKMAWKVLNVLVLVCGVMAQLDIEGHKQLLKKQNKTVSDAKRGKSEDQFQIFNALGESKSIKEVQVPKEKINENSQRAEKVETTKNVLQERQDVINNQEDLNQNVLYSTRFSISQKEVSDPIDRNSQLLNYNQQEQQQGVPLQTDASYLQYQPLQENLTPPLPYTPSYYQAPLYNTIQTPPSYSQYQQQLPDQGRASYPLYQAYPQAYPSTYYPQQEYRNDPLPFGQLYPQNDYLTPADYSQDVESKDVSKKYLGPAYENNEAIENKVAGIEESVEKKGLAGGLHPGKLGYGGHLGPVPHLGHIGGAGHISPGHLAYGRTLGHGGVLGYGGHLGHGGHLPLGAHLGPGIGHKVLHHGHHVPVPVHVPIVKAIHHAHVSQHDHHHKHANQHTHKHNHIDEHNHKHKEEHDHVHRHTHHHDHHHNHKHHSEHAHEEHHKHEHGHQHHEHHVDGYL